MANEEIQVTMGLNTSGFRTELEKSRSEVASFANGMKSIGQAMGGAFGLAAIGVGISKLTGFVEQLKRTSEITGLSTDKVQGINYAMRQTGGDADEAANAIEKLNIKIGEAKDGNPAAISTFEKLGVTLGDADTVLGEIADRIMNAKDEAERARIAFDAFGKSGQQMIPILLGGAKGLEDWTNKAPKISEKEIQDIERFNRTLKDTGDSFMIMAGKAVGAVADVSYFLGKLVFSGFSSKKLGAMEALDDYSALKAADAKKFRAQMQAITEYNQALAERNRLQQEQIHSEDTPLQKWFGLKEKERNLEQEISAMKGDSIAKVNKQIELDKVQFDIHKSEVEMDKKAADDKEQAQAKELEKQKEINKVKDEKASETESEQKRYDALEGEKQHEQFEESQRGSHYASLEEVANFRGPLQRIGQAILRDNLDEKYARLKLNFGRAEWDRQDANSRMDFLAAMGVIDPKDYEQHEANQAMKNTDENIGELLDLAKKNGIHIVANMAP